MHFRHGGELVDGPVPDQFALSLAFRIKQAATDRLGRNAVLAAEPDAPMGFYNTRLT